MELYLTVYCYLLFNLLLVYTQTFSDEICEIRKNKGISVTCTDKNMTNVPKNLPRNTTKLYFSGTNIRTIPANSFSIYPELTELFFRDTSSEPCKLETLEPGAFDGLIKLETLGMIGCSYLTHIGPGVLKTFENLETLHVYRSGLQTVPDLSQFRTLNSDWNGVMREIDFHNNRIQKIQTEDFLGVETDRLKLEENRITSIAANSFRNAIMAKLSLNTNTELTDIDENAFEGVNYLEQLDLSHTKITSLPTKGLSKLRVLILKDTPTMKHLPSVLEFKKIEKAELTYPHHCCAFKNPEKQDPLAWKAKKAQKIINKACALTTASSKAQQILITTQLTTQQIITTTPSSQEGWMPFDINNFSITKLDKNNSENNRKKRHDASGSFGDIAIPNNTKSGSLNSLEKNGFGTVTVPDDVNLTQRADCGEIYIYNRNVDCTPEPDAFNPCEDVMGYGWLRVTVWFVLLAALLGNSAVLIVLTSSRGKFTVPKFLMCNLAFADFIMGVYLILLASIDVRTLGEYFNYAVQWQNEGGCQVAGFLSVFSSELSVFTLTILTLERWYAISHAIHLNKRLKLRQSVALMIFGYTFASILALLPLVGISSYGNVSICLPMKAQSGVDIGYIVSLLVMNGLMFLAICFCYISMFLKVKGSASTRRSNDATIAKRMSILVITNFACWAPIAFFGLTASAGVPLIDITNSKILLVFFYPLNSCANPFLYAILTKQFRKDVFILLGKFGICVERANMYRGTITSRTLSHSRGHKDSTSHRIHRHTESMLTHLSGSNQSSRSCVNGTPKVHPSHRGSSSEVQPFIERRSHLDRAAEFANKEPVLSGDESMLDSWEANDSNEVQKQSHPTYIRSVSDYVSFNARRLPDKSHLRTRTSVDTFLSNSTDTTYVSENSPSQDDVWQMRKDFLEPKNAEENETDTLLNETKIASPSAHVEEYMCSSIHNDNILPLNSDSKNIIPRNKKEKLEIKPSYKPVSSTLHDLRSRFRRSPSLSSLDEGNEMRLLSKSSYVGSCMYDEEGTDMLSGDV